MWTAIASILAGPFINGAIKAYQAKLAAGNTSENIAAGLAVRELAVQQKEIEVNGDYRRSLIGHWYEPVNLLAYIIVLYIGKVVVWDTMLGLGSTPAIKGDVAAWMGMVMLFLVGKRGIENVARILRK
jgi:hypothetical protein